MFSMNYFIENIHHRSLTFKQMWTDEKMLLNKQYVMD